MSRNMCEIKFHAETVPRNIHCICRSSQWLFISFYISFISHSLKFVPTLMFLEFFCLRNCSNLRRDYVLEILDRSEDKYLTLSARYMGIRRIPAENLFPPLRSQHGRQVLKDPANLSVFEINYWTIELYARPDPLALCVSTMAGIDPRQV